MSAEHNDMSQESWDDVDAPQPLPNGVKFRYQGIGASYKKPENEGDDHGFTFVYRPIGPMDEDFDTATLPADWEAQKVFVRFRVPSWNSKFDVKNWLALNGIDPKGLNIEQSVAAFKNAKPVIDAVNKVRTYPDKTTGAMKFEVQLTKVEMAGGDGE